MAKRSTKRRHAPGAFNVHELRHDERRQRTLQVLDGGYHPSSGELRGQSFAGKVLVFPGAKGSSGWSAMFHMTRLMNVAPAAFLFNEMTTKMALGAVVTHSPAMTGFDRDPLDCIETGDWVRVDADRGVVEIIKKKTTLGDRP